MKQLISIVLLQMLSTVANGQGLYDCPCRLISNADCAYPKQTGELRVIQDDSLKAVIFKTASSELVLNHKIYYSSEEDTADKSIQADSLIQQLFIKGLLTSDLLLKEFNRERKSISKKSTFNMPKMKFYFR